MAKLRHSYTIAEQLIIHYAPEFKYFTLTRLCNSSTWTGLQNINTCTYQYGMFYTILLRLCRPRPARFDTTLYSWTYPYIPTYLDSNNQPYFHLVTYCATFIIIHTGEQQFALYAGIKHHIIYKYFTKLKQMCINL